MFCNQVTCTSHVTVATKISLSPIIVTYACERIMKKYKGLHNMFFEVDNKIEKYLGKGSLRDCSIRVQDSMKKEGDLLYYLCKKNTFPEANSAVITR